MATKTRMRLPRSSFLDAVRQSGLLTPDDMVAVLRGPDADEKTVTDPIKLAALFIRKKLLTKFQAMQLLNGKTQGFLLGKYRILDGIRQDRVGLVFLAEERSAAKRKVSIKVLPTDRVSDPTIFRAFLKEVRAAAQVTHPNAARVHDLDVVNETHFVVSEYVPGPTLDKVIAEKGPLAPNVAAQYVAQAAVVLKHAHERGLYHRDVKPANLALTENGVKLLDLGLTHLLENPWAKVTKRISTKEYAEEIDHVAPEQAWGNEPDARSDIYSLGSTLYYLLTGQSPFPGTAAEKMSERQLHGVPKPSLVRPDVPRELDAVVERMAAKDPHLRYQTAVQVATALHPWLPMAQWLALGIGSGEQAPPPPVQQAEPEPAKPRSWLARLFGR
jgi:eukaryotic-like serine/threonine-protein kinase